ncbi:MAG: S41 family peptidase [Fusobacteriota bacterium]
MTKKIRGILVLLVISLVISTTACAKEENTTKKTKMQETGFLANVNELKEISNIIDVVMQSYVGDEEVSKKELMQGAIKGMMNELDSHSVYLSKENMESFSEDMKGEYAGVGMVVSEEDNILTVVSPIEGTPAYKAGMKARDKIISIEGKSTYDLSLQECVDLLKGKPDTDVTIRVLREGKDEPFDVTLTRAIVELKYVKSRMLDGDIGYLRITQFSSGIIADAKKAIKKLEKDGMKAIILDLRNNPGGALQEAVGIASQFVSNSPIVTIKDKNKVIEEHKNIETNHVEVPIVVLVNEGSASASEIVSGAIKDYGTGLILGEKTFGKGTVQNILPLPDGDAIKLTIARYYTPNGVDINHKGIVPDIKVSESEDYKHFEGFITNVDSGEETDKSEDKDEINMEDSQELKDESTEESKNEEKNEETVDKQLEAAKNVLKGILLYDTKKAK